MLIHPDIIHLVSYCEADHAATVDDIVESSKMVREAMKIFSTNEKQIFKQIDWSIVENRKRYLLEQSWNFCPAYSAIFNTLSLRNETRSLLSMPFRQKAPHRNHETKTYDGSRYRSS